jgi:hypothetical protein
LLAHGRWFSPDIPASSTTKTGRHDIAEILLKVALNTKNQSYMFVQNANAFGRVIYMIFTSVSSRIGVIMQYNVKMLVNY